MADTQYVEVHDEASPLARQRATAATWRRVRWGAAVFSLLQFALYQPPEGLEPPFPLLPVGVAVSAVIVAVNILGWLGQRRDDERMLARLGLLELTADTVLALAIVWAFAFDNRSAPWALLVFPVLEGATRRQLPGAFGTWIVVAAGYVAQEFWAEAAYGYAVDVSSITYRMGLVAVVGAISGSLAESLERHVTALQRAQALLLHQAFHDPLTGLPNRALFADRMNQATGRARRDDAQFAVLFIDCDDFKVVNDRFGHEAGDDLLIEMAGRLRRCLRPGDTVARMGGDEFTVLLEPPTTHDEAATVAERVLDVLREPFLIRGERVALSASIGIATGRPDTDDTGALLREADQAMYAAKQNGKDRYRAAPPSSGGG